MAAQDNICFLGWCHEIGKGTPEKPEHDKIWGYMKKDGKAVAFWGRRTANLTFKQMTVIDADEKADEKRWDGGYNPVTWEELKSMDPDFEDRFHEKLCLVMLGNFWHRAGEAYAQK